jgi:hypothetical protein
LKNSRPEAAGVMSFIRILDNKRGKDMNSSRISTAIRITCFLISIITIVAAAYRILSPREEIGSPPSVEFVLSFMYALSSFFRRRIRYISLAVTSALLLGSMGWDLLAYYAYMDKDGVGIILATRWSSPRIYVAMGIFAVFALNLVINVISHYNEKEVR